MALQSKLEFPGDGVTTQWTLNFASGYLNQSDVTCRVGGEAQDRTIIWISETLVEISGATPAIGEAVVFQRITPNSTPINQFSGGDAFNSEAIDASIKQLLLSTQESSDRVEEILQDEAENVKTLYESNADTNALLQPRLQESTPSSQYFATEHGWRHDACKKLWEVLHPSHDPSRSS